MRAPRWDTDLGSDPQTVTICYPGRPHRYLTIPFDSEQAGRAFTVGDGQAQLRDLILQLAVTLARFRNAIDHDSRLPAHRHDHHASFERSRAHVAGSSNISML
jgi:hypothetical protein